MVSVHVPTVRTEDTYALTPECSQHVLLSCQSGEAAEQLV